jgi:Arc-like DNA binding dprotein
MAKAIKRAPGGGRKPRGEFDQLTSPFSLRMPNDLRKQLEAAAKNNGRSVGQELLRRLNDSFSRDYSKDRDPTTRALSFLLAELIEKIQWLYLPVVRLDNPFFLRAVRAGFAKVLKAIEPKGKIPQGPSMQALADALKKRVRGTPLEEQAADYARLLADSWNTPDRAGNKAATDIVHELYHGTLPAIEKMRILEEAGDERVRTAATFVKTKSERTHYGMKDVIRDLELAPKEK